MGIDKALNGVDLVSGTGGIWIADDGRPPPASPGNGTRIGITAAADLPLRWWVPGDPHVSRVR